MKTFTAYVQQYMMPDGRRVEQSTELPASCNADYYRMCYAGYNLAAEMLSTGQVSLTIENSEKDLDIEIVANGPGVQEAYVKMLARNFGKVKP